MRPPRKASRTAPGTCSPVLAKPTHARPGGGVVRVAFLGGLGEIGRNCAVVEIDDRLMLLDCGLMFPDEQMPGVDLVLPDFTWLRENADRVEGCILTHGHEDHAGGLSFLLRELSFPIYGSALTLGLARSRIEEAGLLDSWTFQTGELAPNPIPAKAMLRTLGLPAGQCRLPLGPAPEGLEARARTVWAGVQDAAGSLG